MRIFLGSTNEPDDSLFSTTPYAQFDFDNCGPNVNNIVITGSADPGAMCQGNLTISPELATGRHTFVWSWLFFGSPTLTTFNYVGFSEIIHSHFSFSKQVTCFQLDITNDNSQASISASGLSLIHI